MKVKDFLASPVILIRPREESPSLPYLLVTIQVMSSVLIQETNKVERPVYFVSKVFRGNKTHYQKIEKLALAVVITKMKMRPYIQGHKLKPTIILDRS